MLRRLRLARGRRSAQQRSPEASQALINSKQLPAGDWHQRDGATAPITNKPWDRRARAAGCVTAIRAFTDSRGRLIRVQVRPLTSAEDAQAVLETVPSMWRRSIERVSKRSLLSQAAVALPGVVAGENGIAVEALIDRGYRALVLAVARDCVVVSVVAYGPRDAAWAWDEVAGACRAQLDALSTR